MHLKALLDFARRAYRRPLTEAERADLLAFYQSLRQKEGLSHEDAIRDSVVSVLMSPNFLFRLDLEAAAGASRPPAGEADRRVRRCSVRVCRGPAHAAAAACSRSRTTRWRAG